MARADTHRAWSITELDRFAVDRLSCDGPRAAAEKLSGRLSPSVCAGSRNGCPTANGTHLAALPNFAACSWRRPPRDRGRGRGYGLRWSLCSIDPRKAAWPRLHCLRTRRRSDDVRAGPCAHGLMGRETRPNFLLRRRRCSPFPVHPFGPSLLGDPLPRGCPQRGTGPFALASGSALNPLASGSALNPFDDPILRAGIGETAELLNPGGTRDVYFGQALADDVEPDKN